MIMETLENKIQRFAQLIIDSNNVVALTGAGMSTESGIPDFRSPETGLWTKVDPYEFASITSYRSNASKNLSSMLEMGLTIFKARPNKGHRALTRLQKLGKLQGIMTQNIDRLHQKAKTTNIVEFHGNVMEAICMQCRKIFPITMMVNQALTGKVPSCEECNGLLKPNAVFFGEPLASKDLAAADEMVENCDLLIILGSSLVVYPVAFYPHKALSAGAKLAIINIQKTDMDSSCEVVIHENIGDVFPKIVNIVENAINKDQIV
jgi:NAD-dependent deacetylase